MKTIAKTVITMAIALMVIVGMTGLGAATTEDVTVSIGDGSGTVTIPIMVENVTNLGVCHILLKYDKTVVSVTDATDGEMDVTFPNINSDAGTVNIIACQNSGGINGDVIVANITFAPVDGCSVDTSYLNLTVTILNEATNTSADKILYNIGDGVYTSGYTGGLNGDANGDGVVDGYDVMYIAMYAAEISGYTITCPAIADVDDSGDVDAADARYLAMYLVGDPNYDPLK